MSKIEVNTVEPQCGTTLTLGASGDTVQLGSGASQSGFGRTGTVDWQTGSIKTATFTAVNGEGYFVNTSGSAFNMNLPAGSAGAIVSVADYGDNFATNSLTIVPNGSDKIAGDAANAVLSTSGQSVTLVFVDSTEGWITVNDSTENVKSIPFLIASGGCTVTTSGNYKIHTFNGPGTFTVTTVGGTAANNIVDYLVVAGGGGGGAGGGKGAGGGGGGFRYFLNTTCAPTSGASGAPLNGYGSPTPSGTQITVTAQGYPVAVGGGGAGSSTNTASGTVGVNSTFSTVTSAGGGYGGGSVHCGGSGGSGGGGGVQGASKSGGSGNTPPVTPSQGNNGATSAFPSPGSEGAGGGGGATAAGTATLGASPTVSGGAGGGLPSAFGTGGQNCGSYYYFSGGGGGGQNPPESGAYQGGIGGGGNGGRYPNGGAAGAGTTNTGGGGGGGIHYPEPNGPGASGGSGIVVIRYKYQ
jgi:hypothetical protein